MTERCNSCRRYGNHFNGRCPYCCHKNERWDDHGKTFLRLVLAVAVIGAFARLLLF